MHSLPRAGLSRRTDCHSGVKTVYRLGGKDLCIGGGEIGVGVDQGLPHALTGDSCWDAAAAPSQRRINSANTNFLTRLPHAQGGIRGFTSLTDTMVLPNHENRE